MINISLELTLARLPNALIARVSPDRRPHLWFHQIENTLKVSLLLQLDPRPPSESSEHCSALKGLHIIY